jgi:hypothetical protein
MGIYNGGSKDELVQTTGDRNKALVTSQRARLLNIIAFNPLSVGEKRGREKRQHCVRFALTCPQNERLAFQIDRLVAAYINSVQYHDRFKSKVCIALLLLPSTGFFLILRLMISLP